jgi:uroporphyrinogen decarboxylase
VKEAFLGRKIVSLKDEVEFWRDAGYDYILMSPDYRIEEKRVPLKAENELYDSVDRQWAAEGRGVIVDDEDFEQFPWPDADQLDFGPFEDVVGLLPDGMGVIARGQNILALAWRLMGFEVFSYALADNAGLVRKIVDKLGQIQLSVARGALEHEYVGAFWHADDIAFGTSLLFSPETIRSLLFPYLEEIAAMCRARRIPFIYHSDGNILMLIEDLIELGVDALHPIEPNAMDIGELKRRFGHKLGLIGNIDIDILARGTASQIQALVRERIRKAAPGGGYCIASSNSVPDYVPLDNYRTMLSAAQKYGSYPLEL